MKKRYSIKNVWYGLMIAGGLLPLIIISIIIGQRVYDALLDDALLHNHSINSRIADQFNNEIKRLITLLENKSDPIEQVLSHSSELELINVLFSKILIREERVYGIGLVRPDGNLISHIDRHKDNEEYFSREAWLWFSENIQNKDLMKFPVNGRAYISPVLRDKSDNKKSRFFLAVPVGNARHPAAILIAELALQDLLTNISGRFLRPDYKTYFIDKNGGLLHTRFQKFYNYGELLNNIEIVGSIIRGDVWNEKKIYSGIDKSKVFGTSRSITLAGWHVISEASRDDILFPIYETIFTSFVVIFVIVVLLMWLGLLIARRMIAPIDMLIDSFQKAANHDYSPANLKSPLEEFQKLENGYDAMVSELKNHQQKLDESKHALEENEERFKIVTENIHEVILIISTYWDKVIYVSPAYKDIWGLSCESLYKNPSSWSESIHVSDREQVHLEIISLAVARKPVQFVEFRIQTPNGEIKWIRVKAYPVYDDKDEIASYVYMMQDVTHQQQAQLEQKKLQHQLQQSQKMEAIGQLTGGIAHDFNNMLTAIMGYTSLALDRFGEDVDPKLVEYLSEVDLAGERARDLVSQLLLFSRESNSEPEVITFAPLVKEVIKMLRTSFPKNIDILNEVQPDLPPVLMDPVRLHQLIMNLCINARDAIDGNGSITISSLLVNQHVGDCDSCYKSFQGDFVEIIVEDTGYGIDHSAMGRIFDPFFTTKELGKGTGMGLSIVHGIVHDLGGHIQVSTGPSGTVFRLFFPVVEKLVKSVEVDEEAEQLPVGQGQHILVVDDETSVARFEGELLDHYGYQAKVMTDSEAAMAEFLDNPDKYDLVITDQSMPKMTGTEMAAVMLKERPDLPVILCTGFLHELDPQEVSEIGIKELHAKPISGHDLMYIVQKHLGQSVG